MGHVTTFWNYNMVCTINRNNITIQNTIQNHAYISELPLIFQGTSTDNMKHISVYAVCESRPSE